MANTGFSLNIVFFSSNVVIFLNSASSAAAMVFYLPGVCTHTDTEVKQSSEYFKQFGEYTIFNEHPVIDNDHLFLIYRVFIKYCVFS